MRNTMVTGLWSMRRMGMVALALCGGLAMSLPHLAAAVSFPISIPHFSGRTLLVVNEDENNLVAIPILTTGAIDPANGVALANSAGPVRTIDRDPDAVAVYQRQFAYVQEESGPHLFYRFNLQSVDTSGGSSHVNSFDFSTLSWRAGLVVVGANLFGVADDPSNAGTNELFSMAIDPTTGDLGSPVGVTDIDDGSGNKSTGSGNQPLATDGTCIYDADEASNKVFQICGTTVIVWADAGTGGDAPGISSNSTIVFGPGNQNLFLIENGKVYSTTGPVLSTPGSFSQVGSALSGSSSQNNEGSALFALNGLNILFAGNETDATVTGVHVTGSGSSVNLGKRTVYSGEGGNESGVTGDLVEFDDAEGLAVLNDTPRFSNGLPFFVAPAEAPVVSGFGLVGAVLLVFGVGIVALWRRSLA